ncbi:VanZ family protein [Longispora sp. NPDC051575]|uniref:VanZ family protein n=1 Tax=Longispora sp. NPDC051575 TaxID=3154943 RepID=UPI0034164DBE
MHRTWDTWGEVIGPALAALPLAALAAWALAAWRGSWRTALCDVAMVVGTVPWVWMILSPNGSGRSLSLVPFTDLPGQIFGGTSLLVEQIGGNLLVFAALGFCLPVRWAWFGRWWRLLLVGAAASVTVEALQYALSIGRHSSVDDVLVNGVGALLAGLCSRNWWRSRRANFARGGYRGRPWSEHSR